MRMSLDPVPRRAGWLPCRRSRPGPAQTGLPLGLLLSRLLLLWLLLPLASSPLACRREEARKSRARPIPPPSSVRQLTLVTYNVMGGGHREGTRLPALLAILRAAAPDIVALQEVSARTVAALRSQPWARRYHWTLSPGARSPHGGLLILSRFPISRSLIADLPGDSDSNGLLADLRVEGAILAVLNCHLGSPPGAGQLRASQLAVIFPLMQHAADAVLIGDLGFGDKDQPETDKLDKSFRDLWSALRKDAPGYTWDREINPMTRPPIWNGPPGLDRRQDRILWRSATWRPHTIRLLGDRPVSRHEPSLFPSDHFGLLGVLQR